MTKRCSVVGCDQPTRRFLRRTPPGFRLGTDWYCSEGCLQQGLLHLIHALVLTRIRGSASERSLRPTIGLLLIQQAKITKDELDAALEMQKRVPGARIGELLKQSGVVSEREVTQALSKQFGVPWVNFVRGEIPESAIRLLPAVVARTYGAVPVDYQPEDGRLLLAIVGPPDYAFVNGVSKMLELEVTMLVADESKLKQLVERFYPASYVRGRTLELESVGWRTLAEVLGSKAQHYGADTLRLERLGDRLWFRLVKGGRRRDYLVEIELPDAREVYVS